MKYNTFSEVPSTVVVGAQKDLLTKLSNGTILFEELIVFMNMSKVKRQEIFGLSFDTKGTIGSLFQHRNSALTPFYFGDNFKNWIFEPNKEKTITIPNSMSTLKQYVLPKYLTNIF